MKKVIQIIIGNVLMAFTVSALILDHSIVGFLVLVQFFIFIQEFLFLYVSQLLILLYF